MILKKMKQKKGVSLMISYVLLISIVLALSVGVYSWLKFMADVKPVVNCKQDTSVIIEDFSCDSLASFSNLELRIKNTGRFNINGIILVVGNNSERAPSTYLMPEPVGGLLRGHYYFQIPLKPGESRSIGFTNHVDDEIIVDFNTITVIEIQPFIIIGSERVLCQDAVIRQRAEGCTIFDLAEWEGLISWWKFDEDDEGMVVDSVGDNGGSLNGGAEINVDGELVLDGVGSYVDVPGLKLNGLEELTMSMWVNPVNFLGRQQIFVENGPVHILINEGRFISQIYDGVNWIKISGVFLEEDWNHLVMVFDGSQEENKDKLKLYFGGVFDDLAIIDHDIGTKLNGGGCSQVGRYNDGNCDVNNICYFKGLIDNLMVFHRALSGTEIGIIYDQQKKS